MSSNPFQQPTPPFRRVQTLIGDTLLSIAARELGDGARWYELIYLNQLRPPYLTDDPAQTAPGVLQTGGEILVPSATGVAPGQTDPASVYGSDIAVASDTGLLGTTDGDLALAAGPDNMAQALRIRVGTARGELEMHVAYGCSIAGLLGKQGNPSRLAAASFVRRSLAQDDRVRSVDSATASLQGDALSVTATVTTIAGAVVAVQGAV